MKTTKTSPSEEPGIQLTKEEDLDIKFAIIYSKACYLFPGKDEQELRYKYTEDKLNDLIRC